MPVYTNQGLVITALRFLETKLQNIYKRPLGLTRKSIKFLAVSRKLLLVAPPVWVGSSKTSKGVAIVRFASLYLMAAMTLCSSLSCAKHAVAQGGAATNLPQITSEFAPPLHTSGRWIVDTLGQRVKLKGINWYGASDGYNVVGGLDKNSIKNIVTIIRDLGFNSVRLPFSNAMLHAESTAPETVAANPQFAGKAPITVFDAVVEELTAQGILVILNNHTTSSAWCCGWDDNALWFNKELTTEQWMKDWEWLVERYRSNPLVIGADLRNEIRQGPQGNPNWGGGGQQDWQRAAQDLGNRLNKVNADILIIVEGLNYATDFSGVAAKPVRLTASDKLIYSPHNYSWFAGTDPNKMTYESLKQGLDKGWGFIGEGTAGFQTPIWISEFGAGPNENPNWFNHFVRYVRENDLDWCIWPLNNGVRADKSAVEEWGFVSGDWQRPIVDWRTSLLKTIQ